MGKIGKIENLNLIGKVEIHRKVENLKWLMNLAKKVINSNVL